MNNIEIGKVPPQAVELEEAVLGAVLLDKDAIDEVVHILSVDMFYKSEHQKIYNSILNLYYKSEPIDILTITEELRRIGQLEMIGGAYFVTKLTNKIAGSANIESHAMILKEKYLARELIRITTTFNQASYSEDSLEVLNIVNNEIDKLNDLISNKAVLRTFSENVRESINEAKTRQENKDKGQTSGIKTPLLKLNYLTNGWQTGLIVLAARPGMGKTSFMLSIAKKAAQESKHVAIFSLEMPTIRLTDRLVCAEADIESDKYRDGFLNDVDWASIENAKKRLDKMNIHIDDNSYADMNYIKSRCRVLKKKGKCDIVLIDYLQLQEGSKDKNREQQISEISRKSKLMSKDLDIPVFQLSQLNRSVETRGGDKRPQLSDLRESGAIEQDADMVIFLYRAAYYGLNDEDGNCAKGMGEVIIAKNREGSLGTIKYSHNNSITQYRDYEEIPFYPSDTPVGNENDLQF